MGDLDGDGDLDAYVTNSAFERADRVWLNNGSGLFSDSGQMLGNHRSVAVSLGDLDGDGDLDAFIGNTLGEANRVWLNNGSGALTDSGQSLGNHNTVDVTLGDLDGDLDAFAANNYQANSVWLNNGSGLFSDSGQSLGNHAGTGVSLGDLDGDGDLDAFVANGGSTPQPNRVWLNNGTGQFSDSGQTLGDHNTSSASLGDLDADGDLDAISTTPYEGERVWVNNGGGQFTDNGQRLGSTRSLDISLSDLDGDGDLDFFVASDDNNGNRVWLNQNPATSVSLSVDNGTMVEAAGAGARSLPGRQATTGSSWRYR